MDNNKIVNVILVITIIVIIGFIGSQLMAPTIGNVFTSIGSTLTGDGGSSGNRIIFQNSSGASADEPGGEGSSSSNDVNEGSQNTSTGESSAEASGQDDIAQNDAGHNEAAPDPQERLVIMDGKMTVEARDPTKTVDFLHSLTRRYNGYVLESNLEYQMFEDGTSRAIGYVKIRVPANRLFDAIEEIESQNLEVVHKLVVGDDVTSEYVDLQSRLRNLEDAAVQIQAIMDTAGNVESVLRVYEELDKINEEAEVIRGQIQYYEEASAMSSLAVTVNPLIEEPEPTATPEPSPTPIPESTPTPTPWSLGPTFDFASKRMTSTFQTWLEGWVYFLVYALPVFLLRFGPWLVGLAIVGRWAYKKYIGSDIRFNKTDED